MKQILKGLLLVWTAVAIVFAYKVPNAKAFENHELARLIFFHLPCAWGSSLFLIIAPIAAAYYLKTKNRVWDLRAAAAMEIALILGILTLMTGMIFSDVQWGAPWNWDPRQTSFLLVMLIAGAYFALRAAFGDPEKQASHSAAYALAAVLPELFLIGAFPRLLDKGLHPDLLKKGGGFDSTYWSVIGMMSVAVLGVCFWIFSLRVRTGLLTEALEDSHAELASGDANAPSGVVRPVSLSNNR